MSARSWRRLLPLLYLASLVLYLPACGFHLRGAAPLPPAMERTVIRGTPVNGPLYDQIQTAFAAAGGTLVDAPERATAVLIIRGNRFDRRVLSIAADGRVSEYELSYLLEYALQSPTGQAIVAPQQVTLTRDYSFDPANVLAKDEEEALLRGEMLRFAVRDMLRRLQATLGAEPAAEPVQPGRPL